MAELSRVFALSGDNPWSRPRPRLSGVEMKSVKEQMMTAAREGRVYHIIQPSFKILSTDHFCNDLIIYLSRRLYRAFANFGRLSNGAQSNSVKALRQAFAVACYRGQLDDVKRLLESIDVDGVVRDKVHMLGIGLHFALLQKGCRSREHWNVIKWLMNNTILRDNSLVLKWATIKACNCENNELEEVRWMLQYRELAQHTETIDHALEYALSRHLAVVKCVVEHSDVDFNRLRRVDTLLHDVIWWSERPSDLHNVCYYSDSVAADVYRLVYECGANVNEQYSDGDTPLHNACSQGRQDVVEALMRCGADVNITNDDKRTPAQQAVYYKHGELLPLLDRTSPMDSIIIELRRWRLKLI